jgi:hypothetical protein
MPTVDLDVMHWPIADLFAYREKVGVTPYAAVAALSKDNILNAPPEYMFGFLWIAERRSDKSVDYDALAQSVDLETLLTAMTDAMNEVEPDPTTGADSPPSQTSSPSALPTTGRKTKSSR